MRYPLAMVAIAVSASIGQGQSAGPLGDVPAVVAAERILEQAGGRAAWSNSTLIVEERVYLRSGQVARLRITRDFRRVARLFERTADGDTLIEWVAGDRGWIRRNGVTTSMTATALNRERLGLLQEPYSFYHRFAIRDTTLRVELRSQNATLMVLDRDERVLGWFNLDGAGRMIGWGCFYDGSLNQHYYGPTVAFDRVRLPRWGATSDGRYSFEYLAGTMTDHPLVAPP